LKVNLPPSHFQESSLLIAALSLTTKGEKREANGTETDQTSAADSLHQPVESLIELLFHNVVPTDLSATSVPRLLRSGTSADLDPTIKIPRTQCLSSVGVCLRVE
jgi:hypothetical protein